MVDNAAPIKGVLAAALTALDENFSPDSKLTADHCHWLLANGCNGIGLLGTTGEAFSFSASERMRLLEGVIDQGIPPDRLIVGTGAAALDDAITLTAHATSLGCVGCLVVPPFYFKNISDDGLYAAYDEIITRVDNPALRLYLYNFPQTSAVPITRNVIDRLIKTWPDTIAGLKDSSASVENMVGLARDYPELSIYSGTERLLLDILEAGGKGCIAAGANITAPAIAALYSEWEKSGASPAAFKAQEKVSALRDVFDGISMIPAMKLLLARHLNLPRWAQVVPPMVPITDDGIDAFMAHAKSGGVVLS
ncbi:MAG: dihydrodipicolinate synthase family protein [Rhodospirillales bacterium]|jgi:4-hydroxy-tetrahydrodipicolinate synthase|nr:dihydrodipicolinate synthase family protein [Rhodospirillales bacterium]MBT5076824.1 dihydrodipicolinate synthase family protein [Rhodospirillales bacterium]MBT5112232.1 dihydrodipicolinate synthase family protein [Rhodospirillales bacterium]MBT5671933.1 dihydrodipicolinate synthase family protein [Rhodospirillales bacterium]MBT6187199.1 dihydrodipicolinate synthase family protein [Rhodospirillales bacterium]